MDGLTLFTQLSQALSESSDSSWIDKKTSFDYLYEAACEFVRETECLTASQSIIPIGSTSAYDLNPDFYFLYLTDDQNVFFIKYNDGTNDYMIKYREYSPIVYGNMTTAQAIPDSFTITDKRSATVNITGVATGAAAGAGGESILIDSGATFLSTVSVGDIIHNTTKSADGIVVVVTSNSQLVTAILKSGTSSNWTTSDGYIIVPQGRKQIMFSPAFMNTGGTVTVEYVQKPIPVYSDYRSYRFNPVYMSAIVKYAAWLYKFRDREPSFADAFYKHWDLQLRHFKSLEGKSRKRVNWKVNFNKIAWTDRSLR